MSFSSLSGGCELNIAEVWGGEGGENCPFRNQQRPSVSQVSIKEVKGLCLFYCLLWRKQKSGIFHTKAFHGPLLLELRFNLLNENLRRTIIKKFLRGE